MDTKYLRMVNPVACPRVMLELFGAGNKRGKLHDHTVIGMNGTGTKYAPAAALRLGLMIGVTSSDEQGQYFAVYRQRPIAGRDFLRVVMEYQGHAALPHVPSYALPLMITTLAGRNWDTPIGDDTMKTFRVVREYQCNGWDEGGQLRVDTVGDGQVAFAAPSGETAVYLSWHPEFQEMLFDRPERWFKRLSGVPPIFSVPNIGAIYPKSDDERTRVFCQGVLAYCVKTEKLSSLFDWSTNDKTGLSEEREFRDPLKAQVDFNRLLCALDDVYLARRLLLWAVEHEESLETAIFKQTGHLHGKPPANKDLWVRAWHEQFDESGREAVIATEHEADQTAEHTFGKRAIKVSHALASFLTLCGVKASREFMPTVGPVPEYQEVIADPSAQQRLADVLEKIYLDFPEARKIDFYVYVPLIEKAKASMGLTDFDAQGQPTGRIGIQLAVIGSLTDLVDTLLHELIHYFKRVMKHELAFVDAVDRERGQLFRQKHGIRDEPSVPVTSLPLPVVVSVAPPAAGSTQDVVDALEELTLTMDDLQEED